MHRDVRQIGKSQPFELFGVSDYSLARIGLNNYFFLIVLIRRTANFDLCIATKQGDKREKQGNSVQNTWCDLWNRDHFQYLLSAGSIAVFLSDSLSIAMIGANAFAESGATGFFLTLGLDIVTDSD